MGTNGVPEAGVTRALAHQGPRRKLALSGWRMGSQVPSTLSTLPATPGPAPCTQQVLNQCCRMGRTDCTRSRPPGGGETFSRNRLSNPR